MQRNFRKSLRLVLSHEGGFVNHPEDPGGVTNLGITKKTYEKWEGRSISINEMRSLTVSDVKPIYKNMYWDKCNCDLLPSGVDVMVFDLAVNSGTNRASKYLQRIVGVSDDGVIGPKTILAVNEFVDNLGVETILTKYYDRRQRFYESLNSFDVFGRGWTRRNNETLEFAKEIM